MRIIMLAAAAMTQVLVVAMAPEVQAITTAHKAT
jgi:hypothetical protein